MNTLTRRQSGIVIEDRLPAVIRWIGGRFRDRDGHADYRMTWGELVFGRAGWACELALFHEHYSLHLHALRMKVFIRLGFLQRWHRDPFEIMESWGASCSDGVLHLHWGRHTKILYLPWRHWVQVAHDVRRADGSWAPYVGSWEHDKEPDGRHEETYPYRYVCESAEVQQVEATIHVERRIRKLKVLRWLPFARTSYAIDVQFSDEVGEGAGSWKGGTVGCGYELRPNETPRECLRRMERTRKFGR